MSRFTQKAAAFVLAALLSQGSHVWALSMDDAQMMARCLWGECRGMESTMEKAAVAWCILNRVDDDRWPDTIQEVIGQPNQFTGYKASNPVDEDLLIISMDVITRWYLEKDGQAEVGRVLPREYCFFVGRNGHNYFGYEWPVSETWDWSAEDPYADPLETDIIVEEVDEHDEYPEFRQLELDSANDSSARPVYRGPARRTGRSRRY